MARMRCIVQGRGKNVFALRLCDLIKNFFSWSGGEERIGQETSGTSYYGVPLEKENECAGGAW